MRKEDRGINANWGQSMLEIISPVLYNNLSRDYATSACLSRGIKWHIRDFSHAKLQVTHLMYISVRKGEYRDRFNFLFDRMAFLLVPAPRLSALNSERFGGA